MNNNIPIVIPAYEPNETFIELLKKLADCQFNNIIVVNDGSNESYNTYFEQAKKYCRCILTHQSNQGKGSALKSGFKYIMKEMPEAIGCVTADSDGQHSIDSIKSIVMTLEKNPQNLILGVREFNKYSIPSKSYWGNILTQKIFKYLEGNDIKDTQTGLRGIPISFMKECLLLPGKRFEFEMQMLILSVEKINITQIPIKAIYDSRYNHRTHFKTLKDSLSIYKVLGKKFLLYTYSSISSFLVDILLFIVFLKVFANLNEKNMIASAIVCSRMLSLCYNYLCNYIFVFRSKSRVLKSIILYFILAVIQMFLSFILVINIRILFETKNILGIKIFVDLLLFMISYFIQQKYIFKNNKR